MNCYGLCPLRHFLHDPEDAIGLSIFVLVYPGHDVRSHDTGESVVGEDRCTFLLQASSLHIAVECCLKLCRIFVLVDRLLCLGTWKVWLNVNWCYGGLRYTEL